MSPQLRLSATLSVIAMAAFALGQGELEAVRLAPMETGATIEIATPALPGLSAWAPFNP